jgi:lactate dehydrogenase-like 2-hydroxyacid dehydrogenase
MPKPKLVVTNPYPPAVEERLAREFDVRREPSGRTLSSAEILALADGADALLVSTMDRLDACFFERVSQSIKVIATY